MVFAFVMMIKTKKMMEHFITNVMHLQRFRFCCGIGSEFSGWGNFWGKRKSCDPTPATEKAPCEGEDQKESEEKVDLVLIFRF